MARFDIKLKNSDVDISSGDIRFDASDTHHVKDTMISAPGWWIDNPQDGVNILQELNGPPNIQEKTKKIKLQLMADRYTSRPLIESDAAGKMVINPRATI